MKVRLFRQGSQQPPGEPLEGRAAPRQEQEPAAERPSSPEEAPRAWNLWELERLAEELNGGSRAEERALLLLHLRDFADASGHLPVEFDPLVREAFGEGLAELVG